MQSSRLLGLLVFLSGASGLIYEVIWVRQFGVVFGNTVHSAGIVTSVFLGGLGLGSYWFGRRIDRPNRAGGEYLLMAYARIEFGVAALGILLALIVPHLERVSPYLSRYATGANGWQELTLLSYLARWGFAAILLLPSTFLMGGTLTILIRYVLSTDLSDSGWKVGLLCGANTAGACFACLGVDFFLIPHLGLSGSEAVAAFFNLSVGLRALSLARKLPNTGLPDLSSFSHSLENSQTPHNIDDKQVMSYRLWIAMALSLAVSGFVVLAMEIIWFRFMGSVVGATRGVFSVLLGVILGGMWLGSVFGGWVARKTQRLADGFVLANSLLLASILAGLILFDRDLLATAPFAAAFDALKHWRLEALVESGFVVRIAVLVAAIPAFFSGCLYPLANALTQTSLERVGRRAGGLYFANTSGAVAGAMVAAFALLPIWGIQSSITILIGFALISLVALSCFLRFRLPRTSSSYLGVAGLASLASVLVACAWWYTLPQHALLQKIFPPSENTDGYLVMSEGLTESIAIDESPKDGRRRLLTNGHPMSGSDVASQRYMRAMAHWPLLQQSNPTDALVICFGVGNTAHAVSLHPSVTRLDIVDVSKHVLRHAPYFAAWNHDVLSDSRVKVFVNDGRLHLRIQAPATYDLITLEPPPIAHAGVASLYSSEFYDLARSRLKPGGFLTQWLPVLQVPESVILAMVRSFVDIFPNAVLLHGHDENFYLMGSNAEAQVLDVHQLISRLKTRTAVQEDLNRIFMGTPLELVGSFVSSGEALQSLTEYVSPVTDNFPISEHSFVVFLESSLIRKMVQTPSLELWCPGALAPEAPDPSLSNLRSYLGIMRLYYGTMPKVSYVHDAIRHTMWIPLDDEDFKDTIEESPFLRRLFQPGVTPPLVPPR